MTTATEPQTQPADSTALLTDLARTVRAEKTWRAYRAALAAAVRLLRPGGGSGFPVWTRGANPRRRRIAAHGPALCRAHRGHSPASSAMPTSDETGRVVRATGGRDPETAPVPVVSRAASSDASRDGFVSGTVRCAALRRVPTPVAQEAIRAAVRAVLPSGEQDAGSAAPGAVRSRRHRRHRWSRPRWRSRSLAWGGRCV